jgi:hypothetical protein
MFLKYTDSTFQFCKEVAMSTERRKLARKNFTYYMRVLDEATGKLLGLISDISTGGFKVESSQPLPVNVDFLLRIDQMGELSNKTYMIFTARSKWCRRDTYDPTIYNVGFHIVEMSPSDYDVFIKMFNAYGAERDAHHRNDSDYIWR